MVQIKVPSPRAEHSWAAQFRTTERVERRTIAPGLRTLLDDAKYWIEHQTYQPDQIAIRFHHRLVAIHPFTRCEIEAGHRAAP